ncbi:MAG: DUF4058 family protein [Planctomycetaceae bacterium]
MPSPFPGMDPFIERPAIWPDFHDRLISSIVGYLQPLLRPKYAALTQDRLFLVQSDRPIYPDVAVLQSPQLGWPGRSSTVAVLEPDGPAVFALDEEEIREPYIEIVEAAGGRLVTAIEVISPTNKDRGQGQDAYERKREEYWDAGANLVEIDLLRSGAPIVRIANYKLERLRPWDYLVAVNRRWPGRQEVYAVPLERRLPRVSIPLLNRDLDVVLDLQAPFDRCWDEGPYPALSHYDQPPPGELDAERVAWCQQRLRDAGLLG